MPGVSYRSDDRADVMRGEEVQLLGAIGDGMASPDRLICHHGTHNKWVVVGNGRILSFRTAMTGALFGLLQKHSILSELQNRTEERSVGNECVRTCRSRCSRYQ